MPKYRLSGTIGRKMCDYHERDVLLCYCGYVRRDIVKNLDRKDLVEIHDDGTPVDSQVKMFGRAE